MLAAFSKVIGQIGDPRFQKVMWRGLGLALGVYAGLLFVLWFLLKSTLLFTIPWAETIVDFLGGAAVFGLSLFLFPAVVSVIVGIFLEDICSAVEAKHYPNYPAPRDQSMSEVIWGTVKFAGVTIFLNLLASPIYIVFFFFPPISLLVFYGLNGYLLSREYFELVAGRRLAPREARAMRKANLGYLWFAGALMAFLLTVPVVNMFTPIAGAAFMLHIFERMRVRQGIDGHYAMTTTATSTPVDNTDEQQG